MGEKALMDHDAAMASEALQLFQGCVLGLLHQHQGYLVSDGGKSGRSDGLMRSADFVPGLCVGAAAPTPGLPGEG